MIIRCLVSCFATLHVETATFIILKLAARVLLKQNTSGHKMPLGIEWGLSRATFFNQQVHNYAPTGFLLRFTSLRNVDL